MGQSGPPGTYFYTGIVFLVGSSVAFISQSSVWGWALIVFAGIMIGWSHVATSETYYLPCSQCGHDINSPIRPWSL